MLDPKLLRNDIETVAEQLRKRGFELDIAYFQQLEQQRKTLQTQTQTLQAERNQVSKKIGQAKAKASRHESC